MRRTVMIAAAAALVLTTSIGIGDTYALPKNPIKRTILRFKLPYGTNCVSLSVGGDVCTTPDGTVYICPESGLDTICEEYTPSGQTQPTGPRDVYTPPTGGVSKAP
jgi:hypothetical protein